MRLLLVEDDTMIGEVVLDLLRADRARDQRPDLCLESGQVRQVQRHCLRQGPSDHRCRRGPDEPRKLGPYCRDQG